MYENNVVSYNDVMKVSAGNKIDATNIFDLDLSQENHDKFKQDQLNDSFLISCWKKVSDSDDEFIVDSDNALLYKKFSIAVVETWQLVVPENKRRTIIKTTHDNN